MRQGQFFPLTCGSCQDVMWSGIDLELVKSGLNPLITNSESVSIIPPSIIYFFSYEHYSSKHFQFHANRNATERSTIQAVDEEIERERKIERRENKEKERGILALQEREQRR